MFDPLFRSRGPGSATSFNFYGDGDDVETLDALEAAFDLRFSDADVESLVDFGKLCDLIDARLGPAPTDCCLLRDQYRRFQAGTGAERPHTDLTSLADFERPHETLARLSERTGLPLQVDCPALGFGRLPWESVAMGVGTLAGLALSPIFGAGAILAGFMLGAALSFFPPIAGCPLISKLLRISCA